MKPVLVNRDGRGPVMSPVPAPLCSVARHQLTPQWVRDNSTWDAAEQLRFERICARELLGEVD